MKSFFADQNEQFDQFCNPVHLFGSVHLLISKGFADLYNYSGLIVYLELKSNLYVMILRCPFI